MKAITFASGKGWHWGLIQHKFTVIGMLFLSLPPLHCSKASLVCPFPKRLLNSETHIFVVIKLKALLLTLLRVYCVGHTSLIATEYFQALPPAAALTAPPVSCCISGSHEECPQGWWELPNRGHEPKNRQARRARLTAELNISAALILKLFSLIFKSLPVPTESRRRHFEVVT